MPRRIPTALALASALAIPIGATSLAAQELPPPDADPEAAAAPPSKFTSPEDGWLDVSGFLDEKYGFLPVVIPITEPAVGYGAAGALAFISSPLGDVREGMSRPDITVVGGLGTENGTWGGFAGDLRYWQDDRVQTLVGVIHASVELDFYGIGPDDSLGRDPLAYELEPTGGTFQTKVRLGDSRFWAGASYAYANTDVTFEAPPATPGLPDFESETDIGGLTPSITFDTRDNIFTPARGSYVEAGIGLYSELLGGEDEFQHLRLCAMHFWPLHPEWTLGVRGDAGASFGDEPFYMRPFILLRGAPMLRYQGEEVAQAEVEVRWQFWRRISAVGFAGAGTVWNEFERIEDEETIVTGGAGLRYEIARDYGLHVGLDVAVGPEEAAVYVQFGSAWARP